MHRASPLRSHRQSAAARVANRLRCGKSGCRCAHRAALAGPPVGPTRGYPCHASPLGAFVPHSVAKPAESLVVIVVPLRAPIPLAIVFVPSIQPASPLARSLFVQAPLTHTFINSRDNGALLALPFHVTLFSCSPSRCECARAYRPSLICRIVIRLCAHRSLRRRFFSAPRDISRLAHWYEEY